MDYVTRILDFIKVDKILLFGNFHFIQEKFAMIQILNYYKSNVFDFLFVMHSILVNVCSCDNPVSVIVNNLFKQISLKKDISSRKWNVHISSFYRVENIVHSLFRKQFRTTYTTLFSYVACSRCLERRKCLFWSIFPLSTMFSCEVSNVFYWVKG